MYRQLGGSALLLLLFTSAISHVTGPGREAAALHSESGSHASSPPEASAIATDEHTCYVFEALRLYFGLQEPSSQSSSGSEKQDAHTSQPLVCGPADFAAVFPAGLPRINASDSQVLIATVPDPLQSSEALHFDRDIAALQEAASTAGYDFQRIATPWQTSDLSGSKDLKDAREIDRYREHLGNAPGAMVFRKRTRTDSVRLENPDSLLLLVLVPESPIYGLNLAAGREALGAIRILLSLGFRTTQSPGPEAASRIHWIGPNYSASASGLRTLEQEAHLRFDVLSGSVSTSSANAFLVKLNQDGMGTPSASASKATLSELDQDALCSFLRQQVRPGWRTHEPVVVLQEDETAYGGSISDTPPPASPCSPMIGLVRRFTFPRGISHVRRVYGNALKNAAANQPQQEGSTTTNSHSSLSFRDELEDPLDAVPEFAPQSPVSNESVLAAIASNIKHLQARAIVIRTSDPLDQLFLARYFRQACPDSRLVLFNAERLLTRLRGDFDLDGTLIITRFPLFQNSYLQTPFRGESRHSLTFTNSREESIFLAALLQIKPGHLPLLQSPFAHQRYLLAPWMGIAAGGDFWPVAYFGEETVPVDSKAPNNVLLLTDTPPEPLPVLWTLLTLAVLFVAVIHFLFFLAAMPLHARLKSSRRAWARKMALHQVLSFYLMPPSPTCEQSRLFTGQCWWLLNVSTQLVLVLAYLLFPVIAYQAKVQDVTSVLSAIQRFPIQTTLFAGSALIVLMLQFCMAGTLFLLLTRRCRQMGRGFFIRLEGFLLPCISFIWVLISLGLFYLQLRDRQTGFAFASRCFRLTSGACPILPLLLVSVGFMIAAVVNLNALSMAVSRNPGLPLIHWPYLDLAALQVRLTGYTELWYGLPGGDGKLLMAIVLLGCLLLHPQRLFATFDTPYIGWLYTLNFVLSTWTVLWLWVRFTRIWSVLRTGLDCLEGSPLRFAFSRLPPIFSIDPIWSYLGLRRVVTLPMRWFEYLRIAPMVADEKQALLVDNLNELRIILQEMRDAQWLDNKTYVSFSRRQNEYAIKLSEVPAIRASWERGGPDCALPESACGKAEPAEEAESNGLTGCPRTRPDVPLPCGTVLGPDNCLVEIGNEFIAMRMGAYVRYVTLHMKNLMTFMSLGFLLTLLAAISYPFDRPQIIAWSATITLAALLFTVGTVLAQMDRDPILSRMSNSTPGKVRYVAFLKHMLTVGGLPIITLLATLFPAIGSYLFSWAGPVLESLH